jgi:ABC-type branched-subunit amino acid transport system ATPase component
VRLDGADIAGIQTPQVTRRGVGSMLEARRLFLAMIVRKNLLMGIFVLADRVAFWRILAGTGMTASGELFAATDVCVRTWERTITLSR